MEKTMKAGLYRHYKGNQYEVIGTVRHSETEEVLVLYKPCYGEREMWARPLVMFCETVTTKDGETVARFQYVGDTTKE